MASSDKSASDFWRSRFFSEWRWFDATAKKPAPDLDGIIRVVWRTTNVLANSAGSDDEKQLNALWATGKSVNRTTDNLVYLSPSVVDPEESLKPDWSAGQLTDVLVGEALAESTMKRTIDPDVEAEMIALTSGKKKNTKHEATHRLWYTLERLAAESEVTASYPGFTPYFAANRDYYSGKDAASNVLAGLEVDPTDGWARVAAFQWNLLHPTQPIAVESELQVLFDECVAIVGNADSSRGRSNAAAIVVKKLFAEDPHPSPSYADDPSDGDSSDAPSAQRLGLATFRRGAEVEVSKAIAAGDRHGDLIGASTAVYNPENACTPPAQSVDLAVASLPVTKASYAKMVNQLKTKIAALRARLKFRNEEQRFLEHGLRRGRIDEGSLFKLGLPSNEETLFEHEEILAPPDVAVLLLVDESGSMGSDENYIAARRMTITIVNALQSIHGVTVAVLGHSGQGSCQDDHYVKGMSLHHYFSPKNMQIETLSRIGAFSQNLDGFAIAACTKYMKEWYPDVQVRVIVHVSDGLPEGDGYGGDAGVAHVGRVCAWARQQNIRVVGIGVNDSFSMTVGNKMYGAGNFTIVKSVDASTAAVGNLIVKACSEG